jgi:hypothetical protein
MKRSASLLAVAATMTLSAGQSGAASFTMLNGPNPLAPPAPKSAPPVGFAPAPTPNQDLSAPRTKDKLQKGQAEITASLGDKPRPLRPGDGYAPGSSFNEELQRRNRSATAAMEPSINLRMPIE